MSGLGIAPDNTRQEREINESISRNKANFQLLKDINIQGRYQYPKMKLHPGTVMETQGPGATDKDGNILNDTDGYILNIENLDDDRIKGNLDAAVLGDMLHTIRSNPEWAKMTNDVYGLRDEWQRNNDLKTYRRTLAENYGGDEYRYPLQKFENNHRKDAYTRSVLAPDNNAERWTNAAQETYIKDNMLPYLKSGTRITNRGLDYGYRK
jgi:hypothetical protein